MGSSHEKLYYKTESRANAMELCAKLRKSKTKEKKAEEQKPKNENRRTKTKDRRAKTEVLPTDAFSPHFSCEAKPNSRNDFQSAILDWYAQHKRKLPWRETDDPYSILVSEIMLQQTQVGRVIPKYEAFLQRFPDPHTLAAAATNEVILFWSGLGYNRRAIYLQRAAQQISARRTFPDTEEELRTLSGIGPYTAHAVLSFAFHKDVPVVDTNIRRIFSRYFFAGKGTPITIDKQVTKTLPLGRATDWNNALMDFGSLTCTANTPQCHSCPLQKSCTAYKAGTQNSYLKIAPPQSRFIGSRRQHRGSVLRILKEAQNNTISFIVLRKTLKKPSPYVESILQDLQKDHLVVRNQTLISLPASCVETDKHNTHKKNS